MRRALALLSVGVASLLGAAPAPASPAADEYALPWHVAFAGNRPTRVTDRTRHLRLAYTTSDCDLDGRDPYFRRVEVRRTRRRITLTVVVAKPPPLPGPCPSIGLIVTKRVDLRGRLGHRQLRDGSFTPPRLVPRRPTAP